MSRDERALTGPEKAAVLLLLLGEEAGAAILRQLSEQESKDVLEQLARLGPTRSDQAQQVLEAYLGMFREQSSLVEGGPDRARGFLLHAFGSEEISRMDGLRGVLPQVQTGSQAIRRTAPKHLARVLKNERPQTLAVVLSQLKPSQAAALLQQFPEDMRSEVAMRMAHIEEVAPEIVSGILTVVEQRIVSEEIGNSGREPQGGIDALARLINQMESAAGNQILDSISNQDSSLSDHIRQKMFVFEDLIQLDARDLKELLQKVDKKLLTLALKGTSDTLQNRIFGLLSQRNAEMLRDDLDIVGAVRIREVEAAQQEILKLLREMEQAGTVTLGQDQYVV